MSRYAPWAERVEALAARGRRRHLRTLTPTGPTTGRLLGQDVIVACSNDYLGLAWRDEVRQAARGGGSGASRLISGDRDLHRALEAEVEDWLGRPATLFTSGYHANLGVLGAILGPDDAVASDALNHASLIDGLRLSRARRHVVPHGRPEAIPPGVSAVVVEGLYSMDGDVPSLTDYPREPWLIVDEAHALGCLGPDGAGAAAAQGVLPDVRIGTFGKALGAHAAFVEGPAELREILVNAARTFIFTTAPAEPVVAMALAGLRLMRREPELRERLAERAQQLRSGLVQLGWQALGEAHIVPVVVGPEVMDLDRRLLAAGVFAAGIRPPTVPAGAERVRFTVSAAHTREQIDRILDAMGPA